MRFEMWAAVSIMWQSLLVSILTLDWMLTLSEDDS